MKDPLRHLKQLQKKVIRSERNRKESHSTLTNTGFNSRFSENHSNIQKNNGMNQVS